MSYFTDYFTGYFDVTVEPVHADGAFTVAGSDATDLAGAATAEATFSAEGTATVAAEGAFSADTVAEAVFSASGTSAAAFATDFVPAEAEDASGGWAAVIRYEQRLRRLKREREKLEEAVDEEIAALLSGEDATPAEQAAPQLVEVLREARTDEGLRRLLETQAIDAVQSELAQLLALDRAIRREIRRRRDEDEFLHLLLLAA